MFGFDWRTPGPFWLPDHDRVAGGGVAPLPGAAVSGHFGGRPGASRAVVLAPAPAYGEMVAWIDRGAAGPPVGDGMLPLFVYGTLLRGESRHHVLGGARGQSVSAPGRLADLGDYPTWLPPLSAEDVVAGELYAITSAQVAGLDEIEDFRGFGAARSLFRRIVIERAPGRFCWTYLAAQQPARPALIASGDWRKR